MTTTQCLGVVWLVFPPLLAIALKVLDWRVVLRLLAYESLVLLWFAVAVKFIVMR